MYLPLCKGMAVYRQNHTRSYYLRLRIDKKEIRRSLSTSDLEEAKVKAWQTKFEYEGMKKAGIEINPTKSYSLEKAMLSIIKQLENKKPFKQIYKDYILVYNNFIIPYFKNKTIDDLTTKNIRLYFESREFSKTRKTINRSCFTRLFEYLEEEGELKKRDFPTLPKEIKTAQMHIGFDFLEEDLKNIRIFLRQDFWLNQSGLKAISVEYRNILIHVFEFLLETGFRPGLEMNSITFNDIYQATTADNKKRLFVHVRNGKTSYKNRESVLSDKAIDALIQILKITQFNQNITKDYLIKNNSDKPVFESSNNKICDFCKLFDQLIKKMISLNKIKKKYTLYCCRHTYITNQLKRGVDKDMIAKQVGNTSEVIEKHYDHAKMKDMKDLEKLFDNDKKVYVKF
ncbi:tyrosine-type recombinase/integrase [Vibrio campbellii]